MDIRVKVATILLNKAEPPLEKREFARRIEDGSDVGRLIMDLGIPPRLVGSVTVNKKRSGWDRRLVEGDAVAIIPAISGG